PASPTTAQSPTAGPRKASRPRARVARAPARTASAVATAATSTPNVTTTMAPVGRSHVHEATRPATLTRMPSAHPTSSPPRADLGGRDGEDAPDQDLLDVLAALGRSIHDEHGRRRGHGVDDADDRLLGHRRPARAACREQRSAAEREGERVPVGGLALDRVPG